MPGNFSGATAVITGGAGQASGLGRGLVLRCFEAGMNVAVLDRDGIAAQALATELDPAGRRVVGLAVDVTSADSLADAAQAVKGHFGSCHFLFAHVGGGGQGRFDGTTDAVWQEAMQLMVLGTVNTVQAFLPLLRATSAPRRIVLTSSVAALAPGKYQGPYRAAKAAVGAIGETLAVELAEDGIGVTIAYPSGMLPPGYGDLSQLVPDQTHPPQTVEQAIAAEMVREPCDLAVGEDAAHAILRAVEHDNPYVVTHGRSFEAPFRDREAALHAAIDELAQRAFLPTVSEP